ncbi:MAG: hypothetical protein ACOVP1_06975 [Bacteroidia bacterium]
MSRFLIFLLFFFVQFDALSQIDVLTGESSIDWPSFISEDAIKKEAKEKAIINGIERKYGQVVLQGNSTYVKNLSNGQMQESQSVFYSSSQSLLKGEFLRMIGSESYEVLTEKRKINGKKEQLRVIKCKITFEAKEVAEQLPQFTVVSSVCEAKPLNCKTNLFYNGDRIFIYFKSPIKGYLAIYADYIIEGNHYCSRYLPVKENGDLTYNSCLKVEGEKEYTFFASDNKQFSDGFVSQEVVLVTNENTEPMRFFIIFSENPISSPQLSEIPVSQNFKEKNKGYHLPLGIRSEKFQEWIYQQRAFNKKFQHKLLDITISKFRE